MSRQSLAPPLPVAGTERDDAAGDAPIEIVRWLTGRTMARLMVAETRYRRARDAAPTGAGAQVVNLGDHCETSGTA